MQHKWFFFTPQSDGFDVIVRYTGAENGDVLAEASFRGKDFEKFVNEVVSQALDCIPQPQKEPQVFVDVDGDGTVDVNLKEALSQIEEKEQDVEKDVVEEAKGWFGGKS
jgi:hypothetical protein